MAEDESGVNALAAKNAELLGELKTVKSKLKELDGLDVDQLKSAAEELRQRQEQDLLKEKEYEKLLNQQKEDHARQLAEKTKALEEAQASVRGVLVDSKLRSALATANVDPLMMDAAVDMLSHKVAVTNADGTPQARLGDKDVKDWVSEWSQSPVGKRFVLADTGSGSGTVSGSTPNGKEHVARQDWEQVFNPDGGHYNLMAQSELLESDPKLYESLVKKYQAAVTNNLKSGGIGRG